MNCETVSENVQHIRLKDYKARSTVNDQEVRRSKLLENQKRSRGNALNNFRGVSDVFAELESDHEREEEMQELYLPEEHVMEWTETKAKIPRLKDMFMLSEWMIKLPDNIEDKWLFVLCPVGKRCLVRSTRGYTTVFGRKGQQLAKFQSSLPNGSQIDYNRMTYSNSEVTLLDCIWNSHVKSYFVLDVLSWKGQFYMDTETSFRAFWIKSKLQEMPWLSARSDQNPFPFNHLDHYQCNLDTLSLTLQQYPHFTLDTPKIDGILFYHSEAYYTPGHTPLVVWLKPFMIPEVFRIEVSDRYMVTRPATYVNMITYIGEYESKEKLKENKNKRKIKGHNLKTPEESVTEIEMMDEMH
ncbi:hypothetical protein RUM44_005326 [Polyplax serrata]|uniref:Snurportin-1 n=1 Tax=Polyplax serrata TaxID=468196 RepID=A0ABR1AEI8_POLSC